MLTRRNFVLGLGLAGALTVLSPSSLIPQVIPVVLPATLRGYRIIPDPLTKRSGSYQVVPI